MKAFIICTLVFILYIIPVKGIYDEKLFLTEDVKILENEVGKRDSIVLKLQYENVKLKEELKSFKEMKNVKKQQVKPIVKKPVIVEEVKPEINDTTKSL